MRMRRLLPVGAAVLALGLVLSGCGDDGDSTGATEDKGALSVVSAGFTEIDLMANMYQQVLENNGYDVELKTVTTREQYLKQIAAGNEDVVPDYLGSAANFLYSQQEDDPDAVVATSDVEATLVELRELAEDQGLVVLDPSEATDQNAYAVTTDYAKEHSLTTLSDLGASGLSVVIAAPEECKTRPLCGVGLEETYGIDITEYKPFPFDSATGKKEVTDGKAQLVQVATSGTSLGTLGLVVLEDDKNLQPAENLTPIVSAESALAADAQAIDLLNELSRTLTTEDLAALNDRVNLDKELVEDVARDYLESKGLL